VAPASKANNAPLCYSCYAPHLPLCLRAIFALSQILPEENMEILRGWGVEDGGWFLKGAQSGFLSHRHIEIFFSIEAYMESSLEIKKYF
jgi:hypothetical protein